MKMKTVMMMYVFLIAVCVNSLSADMNPPVKGGQLPEFTLKTPAESEYRRYLGVDGDIFTAPSVKSDIVIIQIFSMYCPHCQKDAPLVNQLYERIETKYKNKIKLIGVGAGNSEYEVSYYRKKYQVPFPMFSDPDFTLHKLFGEVRTPYFIAIAIRKNGTHRIVYSKLGSVGDPDDFIKQLIRDSEGK